MKNAISTRSCPAQAAGDACPICLDKVFAGEDAVFPPCGHALHEKCASAVASTGSIKDAALFTCPVCRKRCPHDELDSAHREDPLPCSKAALRHRKAAKFARARSAFARVCAIKHREPSLRADTAAFILAHRKKWRAMDYMHSCGQLCVCDLSLTPGKPLFCHRHH